MMPLTVTARDSEGAILATESFSVQFVAPNDVMPYANTMTVAEEPASVDFSIGPGDGGPPGHPYTLASFAITNDSEQVKSEYEVSWTGEVTNNAELDFPSYWAYALLYKDGALVGGYGTYTYSPLDDGATVPFTADASYVGEVPDHDSYVLYVLPDLLDMI